MSTTSPSVARSSLLMASGSMVSRVLGVVRQSLIVLAIGQGVVGNAFATANTLPNVIYMVIAGGVLNSMLVPQLVKAATNPDGGREYTDRIITLAAVGFFVVTAVCTAGAGLLIRLYSQDLSADTLWLATLFAAVTIPQIFFYALYALLGQVLNARGQFAAFGWSPALANVVSILGLLAFMALYDGHVGPDRWSPGMVAVLAGSATLSVVVQALFLIVPLWRTGFRWTPRFGFRGVGLRSTSQIAGWAFAALLLSQLGYLVASNVMWHASNQSGELHRFVPGVAVYSNALFVFMVPHAFVAVSIITALYPRMSRAAHDGDVETVRAEYVRGITVPSTVTVPASVALAVFCVPITEILFASRDPAELPATALVLAAMALGVVPFGIDVLNQRFFYMHENGRLALGEQAVLTASATAITLLALLLPPWYVVPAIGAGIVVSNVLASLFGIVFVQRTVGRLPLRQMWSSQARMVLASLVAALPGFAIFALLRRAVDGRLGVLVVLAVAGVLYGLVYLGMARLLRITEVSRMMDLVARRLPGGRRAGRHEG